MTFYPRDAILLSNYRSKHMRLLLFLVFLINFVISYSQQNVKCINPMNVKLLIKGMNNDDSTISKKQLLDAEEVIAENKRIQILNFTASLRDSGEIVEFSVAGTKFSDNHRKQFKRLRSQSDIYFFNIQAKNEQGFVVCLKPVLYRITE